MDFKASDGVTSDAGANDALNEVGAGAAAPAKDEKAVTMTKTDAGSDALIAAKAGEVLANAMGSAMTEAAKADAADSKKVNDRRFTITTDNARDANLTEFGKETLTDRYLLPGENYQDLFARVADAYADDEAHAQRLYDYISNLWFMPATPVLSNGGTNRGLPISCYLNSVSDSLEGIVGTWNENVWLASKGGGIGTYWGNVRGIGEPVGLNGKTLLPSALVPSGNSTTGKPLSKTARMSCAVSVALEGRPRSARMVPADFNSSPMTGQ
jgi:ribonucleoside-diphosphate reductase alpha chain